MKKIKKLLAGLLLAVFAMGTMTACCSLPGSVPTSWNTSRTKTYFALRRITAEHVYLTSEVTLGGNTSTVAYEAKGADRMVQLTTANPARTMGYSYTDGVYTDLSTGNALTTTASINAAKSFIQRYEERLKVPSDSDKVTGFSAKMTEDENGTTYTETITLENGSRYEYVFDKTGKLTNIIAAPAGASSSSNYPIQTLRRQR